MELTNNSGFFIDIRANSHWDIKQARKTINNVFSRLHVAGVLNNVFVDFPGGRVGENPTPGLVLRLWPKENSGITEDGVKQALESLSGFVVSSGKKQGIQKYWRRFRIPTRPGSKVAPERRSVEFRRRANRIEQSKSLFYLDMESLGNKGRFRMYIQPCDQSQLGSVPGNDSYGLVKFTQS